jgi:hypothetical protein
MRKFYKPLSYVADKLARVIEGAAKVAGDTVRLAGGIGDLAGSIPAQYAGEKIWDATTQVNEAIGEKVLDVKAARAERKAVNKKVAKIRAARDEADVAEAKRQLRAEELRRNTHEPYKVPLGVPDPTPVNARRVIVVK